MVRSLLTYLVKSVENYPDDTALKYKSVTLSYHELELRSSQLGALLIEEGTSCGDRVCIYLDKTPEAVVSIFAALRSGACYVPLDPRAPESRLAMIMADCRPKWLITSAAKLPVVLSLAPRSPGLEGIVVIDGERSAQSPAVPNVKLFYRNDLQSRLGKRVEPPRPPDRHDLAYILYTSGSTGQPKGVMISHGAACAFVDWAHTTFGLASSDVLSAHAPLHFDLSIFDIFAAVAAGAAICLVPQGWSSFPKTVADFIAQNKITTWYSVPTALVQLVLHGGLENRVFPELRQILFAGEVFPSKYLTQLMELLPEVDFYNLYGPTETNVITWHQILELPAADEDVPIGTLCDGVTGYVISEAGTLASTGEIGELCIRSPTLMEGYWGDEQKTEAVMMDNPCADVDESPLYKTGDLVHLEESGLLIYHGRSDAMVKSRGYRIELGEIETVLTAHPKIKESVVLALPSEQFSTTLGAVLVAEPNTELDTEDVLRFCRDKLPTYMVPEKIGFMNALPRTSTGKIDRHAMGTFRL